MIEKMLKKLEELNIESQSCSECAYIKECDAMQEKYDIPDNVCLCTMLMKLKAKEIVQEVAKEYNNGWIPVEDRLPDHNIDVEVTLANWERHICWYSGLRQEWIDAVSDDESTLNVIAWKEPSEPYQPKGE